MAMVLSQGRDSFHKTALYTGLKSLIGRIETRWQRHLKYQQVVRELGFYNQRQLADMGIARSDISRLAHETAAQL